MAGMGHYPDGLAILHTFDSCMREDPSTASAKRRITAGCT
jgi:hypothetical protein